MISVLWWIKEKWLIFHLFSIFIIWMRVMTPKFLTHQTRNWKFDSVVSVFFLPSFPSPLILLFSIFPPFLSPTEVPPTHTLFLRQDFAKVATGRTTAVLPYYSVSLVLGEVAPTSLDVPSVGPWAWALLFQSLPNSERLNFPELGCTLLLWDILRWTC